MNNQQELLNAIQEISSNRNTAYDTPATVLRVEGDTVWVHIEGGADETPVQKTVSCEPGEIVQVRISKGSAFLVGNASAPPTDDKMANIAHFVAEQAEIEAANAKNEAIIARQEAEAAVQAARNSIVTYETWYLLSATEPTQPTEASHAGWSTVEPAWASTSTDNLYFSIRTVRGDGTTSWSAVGMVQSYADLQILKNAIISTVASDYVGKGDSGVSSLSSTMLQNENGVNIYNGSLAVGDSYAHIDGNSFDIKKVTTAGSIDDTNDTILASFGREITVGSRRENTSEGQYSQVYGYLCEASGNYSHAEGYYAKGVGHYSHAEGSQNRASGNYSHAEGENSVANGNGSHVEGFYCEARGNLSHAEGNSTTAIGESSHAEGGETQAVGESSHAEGLETYANGDYSHAQNIRTIADSAGQTAMGKYNVADSNNTYVLIIGNGSSEYLRSDALRVDWNGNILAGGTLKDLNGNPKLDAWTATATVNSSKQVTFSGLNDSYGYDLYCQNKLVTISSMSKSGSGTSVSITYTLGGAAASGDVCKLRILR